jgi:DNA-binding IclR family transcriptional regulator
VIAVTRPKQKSPAGIQSVEIGLKVLDALVKLDRPAALREVARQAGLSTSKIHRYLVSLSRTGLVVQHAGSGAYDLGPKALHLGLAALSRLDSQKLAADAVETLHARTGHTVALFVWGNRGPTIVRWKEAIQAVTVNARPGHVLSTTGSASGRVFAAFLPQDVVAPFVQAEFQSGLRAQYHGRPIEPIAFERLLDNIRKEYISIARGDVMAGVDAISAPVFNHEQTVTFVLSVWGAQGLIDVDRDGDCSSLLLRTASELSSQLGYSGSFPLFDSTKKLVGERL